MQEIELNWLAVAVAALVPMALGALWYSLLFARPWMRAVGRSAEDMSGASIGYGLSAIAALVTSYTLARVVRWAEVDDLANGVLVGCSSGSASSRRSSPCRRTSEDGRGRSGRSTPGTGSFRSSSWARSTARGNSSRA